MKKNKFDFFEITYREIIASVTIVSIMLIIGILISNSIAQTRLDLNEKYNKAVKIETSDLFEYGMRTNIGDAFVYGKLKAVDTVSYPGISGKYLYLEKIKERYTQHTRTVSHTRTVNGKTQTYYTTEIYWSWDRVDSESIHSKEVYFNDVVFSYEKINYPSSSYIDTIQESFYIRYKYYGIKSEFEGTIFTTLKNGTISDHSPFYEDKHIEDAYKNALEPDYSIVFFWIFWLILTGGLIFAFYYIDNKWLY